MPNPKPQSVPPSARRLILHKGTANELHVLIVRTQLDVILIMVTVRQGERDHLGSATIMCPSAAHALEVFLEPMPPGAFLVVSDAVTALLTELQKRLLQFLNGEIDTINHQVEGMLWEGEFIPGVRPNWSAGRKMPGE